MNRAVVWTKNNTFSSIYSHNGNLTIHNASVEDSGRYICTLKTDEMTLSAWIDVSISPNNLNSTEKGIWSLATFSPSITISPKAREILIDEGDSFELVCLANDKPSSIVRWVNSNGTPISNEFKTQNSMKWPSIKRSDEGTYNCHALNLGGESINYVTLSIRPKPTKPHYLYNVVTVGQRAEISCTEEHTNKNLTWSREDGQPLPKNSYLSGNKLASILEL